MKAMSDGDICDMIEEVTAKVQKLEDRQDAHDKEQDIVVASLDRSINALYGKIADLERAINMLPAPKD